MSDLTGEVALVTGGASGIGRAVVRRYVQDGAKVAVFDQNAERLEELQAELGDSVIVIAGDVRSAVDNARAVKAVVEGFGKLDVLVANAGLGDAWREFADMPVEQLETVYDEVFDVNVRGVLLSAKAALPELVKTRGSIIVTLSNSAFYPDGGGVMYIASKHAALGVVRQLAHEFAPMVRVNAVSPGATRTDIRMPRSLGVDDEGRPLRTHTHPDNKDDAVERVVPVAIHADPEDHAGAYALLACRADSRVMTGSVVDTEGGLGVRGLRRVRGGDDLPERLNIG